MTLTIQKAANLIPKINRSVVKRGKCKIWIGPKYPGGSKSMHPYVGDGHDAYRVRRVVWIAANGDAPTGQRYSANCGTAWCVSLAHIEVHERQAVQPRPTRKPADPRCEDCGRPRAAGSIARCVVCSAKRCSGGRHKAYGVIHLKNVHAAREFRKRLVERKGT